MAFLEVEKVVFSGRFDPPHPGHIATIKRLSKIFNYVEVVILDYPERRYPLTYCLNVLEECLVDENNSIGISSNKTHFAKLTITEWLPFNAAYYAAGNLEVLKHIESLGIKTYYVDRAFDYSSRKYEGLSGNS